MMFNKSVIFTFAPQATEAALCYGKQRHIAIKIKAKYVDCLAFEQLLFFQAG